MAQRRTRPSCSPLVALLSLAALGPMLSPIAQAQEGPDFLAETYTCDSGDYQVPFVAHNGTEVIYGAGSGITARDPKTSLVRWQGGELKHLRQIIHRTDQLLLIGEHVQLVTRARGERLWDFPLNCFPGECNADVVARSKDTLLIGGFGQVYNMVTPVDLATGKEVWPSWLSVCPFKAAAFLDDTIVLMCQGMGSVLQRIDMASRKTLYTAPLPQADFTPKRLFPSQRFLFVEGEVSSKRKLAVFDANDGRLVRTFKVKVQGDDVGFLVSPEAGRFIPWQKKGPKWLVWGMDAETGKVSWHKSFPGGRLVGQVGDVAIVLSTDNSQRRIVGLTLANGEEAYRLDLDAADPKVALIGSQLFIGLAAGPFLVADAQTGKAAHVGQAPESPAAAPGRIAMGMDNGHFLLLDQSRVTVFAPSPLSTQTDAVVTSLDDGDLDTAHKRYDKLAPFRALVPAVDGVRQDLVSYRFLTSLAALREDRLTEAVELISPWLAQHANGATADFLRHHPNLLRVVVPLSLVNDGAADTFLLEVLDVLLARAAEPGYFDAGMDRTTFVSLAVALAIGIRSAPQDADAFALLRKLHERQALAPLLEGHPYWTHFLVEEVSTTLEAANEAGKIEEFGLAANFLRDLSKLPLANQLFGATFDPWIDAQGAYLMPTDIQARKIPELLQALSRKLDKATGALLKDSQTEICVQRCRLADRFCPGTCTLDEDCQRATTRCIDSCDRGRMTYRPPAFIMPPGSDGFPACR